MWRIFWPKLNFLKTMILTFRLKLLCTILFGTPCMLMIKFHLPLPKFLSRIWAKCIGFLGKITPNETVYFHKASPNFRSVYVTLHSKISSQIFKNFAQKFKCRPAWQPALLSCLHDQFFRLEIFFFKRFSPEIF